MDQEEELLDGDYKPTSLKSDAGSGKKPKSRPSGTCTLSPAPSAFCAARAVPPQPKSRPSISCTLTPAPSAFRAARAMPPQLKSSLGFCTLTLAPLRLSCAQFHIQTWGCQMNKADTERMAGAMEDLGMRWTDDINDAQVVVCNTCAIRESAEHKVYSALGYQADRKRQGDDVTLVFAGCVAQQEGDQLLRRVPELDMVLGPQHANRIGSLLEDVWSSGRQIVATEEAEIVEDISQPRRESSVTAWVNIIYGCNERCTYCVVPFTRGSEQSRQPDAIRKEVEGLAAMGYKEITLLGQNIDAYGRDLPGSKPDGAHLWTLTDLLHLIHDVDGIERIRFTTSHPRYFSSRLIAACAELPKVMPYFNIPFQSGDDDVLKAMKRGYSIERYKAIIAAIRERIPDAGISADAIVGFPGETEEQFMNTVRLVEEIQFDVVNTAAYSPRPNTPAAVWEDQLPEEVKKDRLHRLNRAVNAGATARSQRYLGRVEEVLVEISSAKREGIVVGRTPTNRAVHIPGSIDELRGKFVDVLIDDVTSYVLRGKIVEVRDHSRLVPRKAAPALAA
eukprot:tig00020552_g10475.t1